jgi:hypothetical protein
VEKSEGIFLDREEKINKGEGEKRGERKRGKRMR